MLLGIDRVIRPEDMQPGKFYLRPNYRETPTLFLLARGVINGEESWRAVEFDTNDEHPITISDDITNSGPVVELPDVHVRVDGPSIGGTSYTDSIRAPLMFVEGGEAYVAALTGWRGAMIVKISDGEIVQPRMRTWVSFSRWQLVIEDAGEEIPIASFGIPT